MERLDKFLCDSGAGTRSQVKLILKSGRVKVDGKPEKDGSRKIQPEENQVCLDGVRLGINLYGYGVPLPEGGTLRPVLRLETSVVHLHPLLPGERVGYGGLYQAGTPRTPAPRASAGKAPGPSGRPGKPGPRPAGADRGAGDRGHHPAAEPLPDVPGER